MAAGFDEHLISEEGGPHWRIGWSPKAEEREGYVQMRETSEVWLDHRKQEAEAARVAQPPWILWAKLLR